MTVEAEEETEVEEETNSEAETVTTPNVKEIKDSPNSHANISTRMVSTHTAVLNASPKDPKHQNTATTQNMQGGSTLNCFWLWQYETES